MRTTSLPRALTLAWVVVVAGGCPKDDTPSKDAGPPADVRQSEGSVADQQIPVPDGTLSPSDHGFTEGSPYLDLRLGCVDCLLEEICVHFVNQNTCEVLWSQCKYRSPGCFSPSVNPCCQCEDQVCGLWYQCAPTSCSQPDAGVDPGSACFCYSK